MTPTHASGGESPRAAVDVAVLGAGPHGLAASAHLRRSGGLLPRIAGGLRLAPLLVLPGRLQLRGELLPGRHAGGADHAGDQPARDGAER